MQEANLCTALVLGATGLVGRALVAQLKNDQRYRQITCLVRHCAGLEGNSCQEVITDFSRMQDYASYFQASHIYVCLGTTIKQAGSKAAFRAVDFDLVYQAAQLAAMQQALSFVWISSVGADARSRSFYLRTKGELEEAIFAMQGLKRPAQVRPSLLLGERREFRFFERLGTMFAPLYSHLLHGRLAKYRPIAAEEVAEQMIGLQYFG